MRFTSIRSKTLLWWNSPTSRSRMPWDNRVRGSKRMPKKNDFFMLGCLIFSKEGLLGKMLQFALKKIGPKNRAPFSNRSSPCADLAHDDLFLVVDRLLVDGLEEFQDKLLAQAPLFPLDRKSTRLNSSHV